MKNRTDIKKTIARIAGLQPRLELAFLPTPLQRLPRLSRRYGVDLFLKRDDMTGPEFGGNKTRKLEYVLPGVLAAKADCVVTGASVQSNWCRQVAAAGNRCGLKTVLYLFAPELPGDYRGNLLLDAAFGAEIHLVKLEKGENLYDGLARTEEDRDRRMRDLAAEGRSCRYLKVGAPVPEAYAAYAAAMGELALQMPDFGLEADDIDYIVTPIGSGGTYAGLLAGALMLRSRARIIGFTTSGMHPSMREDILCAAGEAADYLRTKLGVSKDDIHVDFDYGGTYDIPTPGSTGALRIVAREEGVLLDPVYGAKAMAGLLDYLEKGRIPAGSRVVFWHTGGLPALFSGIETAGPIHRQAD